MIKKMLIKLVLSSIFIFSTFSIHAQQTLSFGYSIDYHFKPNEAQDIVNNYFFTIKANCKIETVDESDDLLAKILSGKGVLNSNELNKGDELTVNVHNGDTLKITAPSGAKVRLINLGLHEVKASCYPA